jgi:hypothetical protein
MPGTFGRVDEIVQRYYDAAGDPSRKGININKLLLEMFNVQNEIAQRGFALKDRHDLVFEANNDTYDLGQSIFRLKEIVCYPAGELPTTPVPGAPLPTPIQPTPPPPPGWGQVGSPYGCGPGIWGWPYNHRFEIITNPTDWQRAVIASRYCTVPRACRVWNQRFIVTPTPQQTGHKVGIYFYRRPTNPLALGQDPELDIDWDYCLLWGTLNRLGVHPEIYGPKYEAELARLMTQELNETLEPMRMSHWSDGLDF